MEGSHPASRSPCKKYGTTEHAAASKKDTNVVVSVQNAQIKCPEAKKSTRKSPKKRIRISDQSSTDQVAQNRVARAFPSVRKLASVLWGVSKALNFRLSFLLILKPPPWHAQRSVLSPKNRAARPQRRLSIANCPQIYRRLVIVLYCSLYALAKGRSSSRPASRRPPFQIGKLVADKSYQARPRVSNSLPRPLARPPKLQLVV